MSHSNASQLGKHHVVPEVEQVQQQTEDNDQAEHEHVLACPLHLLGAVGDSITVVATCTPVLHRKDEGIDEVDGDKGCESHGSRYGIPVGTQELANSVVSLA